MIVEENSVTDPASGNFQFPLRRDRNGWRAVYKLSNEAGNCSFGCKFCGVGRSPQVTSAQNIAAFDALHAKYLADIDCPYHPAIFNRGNVTDPEAFSSATLNHILDLFARDERVRYVSLNSRESTATVEVLDRLAARALPFPVHFIFGQESFSESAQRVLGKSNRGEMERFVRKLKRYNQQYKAGGIGKPYLFGLDVNLLFLPELYLEPGELRKGSEAKIARGVAADLQMLLARTDAVVPTEVNIHPFYEVAALPYCRADLSMLLGILPRLRAIVEGHNWESRGRRTHLFLGVVLFSSVKKNALNLEAAGCVAWLTDAILRFNETGELPSALRRCVRLEDWN